jgi:hypothetical protein
MMNEFFYTRGTKGKDDGDTSATTRRGEDRPHGTTMTTKE